MASSIRIVHEGTTESLVTYDGNTAFEFAPGTRLEGWYWVPKLRLHFRLSESGTYRDEVWQDEDGYTARFYDRDHSGGRGSLLWEKSYPRSACGSKPFDDLEVTGMALCMGVDPDA